MITKKTILIIAGVLIVGIIAFAFISLKNQEPLSKCKDGICDERETVENCPEDCKIMKISDNRFGVFPSVNPIDILESAKQLGIRRTRLMISWEKFEPEQDQFDFSLSDLYINKHYEAGISPVITIKSDSSWGTRRGYDDFCASPPLNWADYEDFVRTAVDRYKDKVKYWQIENEVYENSKYWAGSKEEYIELLQHAYTTIKQVDPDAKVVLQGYANQMLIMINDEEEDVTEFFNYIMSYDDYFDVIDFHQYYEPDTVYMEVELLKSIMNTYGYSKPLICTEAGGLDLRLFGQQIRHMNDTLVPEVPIAKKLLSIPSVSDKLKGFLSGGLEEQEWINFGIFLKTDNKSRPILEKYQAENLVKRVSLTLSQGVEFINWFAITDFEEPNEWFFSHLGLLDTNGRKKPHYYTYELLIDKLEGFESVDEISFEPRIIRFSFPHKSAIYVLWNQKPIITDMTSYFSEDSILVSHIITELDNNNNPIYPSDKIVSTNSIQIDATPVFVEKQ